MESIRIVLADDHWLMRDGTRRILEQNPGMTVVGEAENGDETLQLIERLKPDVVVLDIRMPKLNGIEIIRRMKSCCPNTRALILTGYDDDEYILAAMEAGASGYLLKTARAEELINSVQSVHQGEPFLQPTIAAKVARLWAHRTEKKSTEQLSHRELEVLELAARGLRNKVIADKMSISVRTVEGHFNSIFIKLNVSSRIEAILYAISKGIIDTSGEGKP